MTRLLICKEKKETIDGREHIVIKQKKYTVERLDKDFQTTYGIIPKEELKKESGSKVKTKTGKEFIILDLDYIDQYKELKKLPQTIPLKDIGLIIGETGINKNSKTVDAGLGSAALTIALANICKKVTAYEIREDFIKQAKENIDRTGLKNITIKHKDITKGMTEKEIDLVTLDLPEPWQVVEHAAKALRVGGWVVSYSPSIPQVQEFVETINKDERLFLIKTVEVIERLWEVKGRKVRPKSISIGHSGFMTFARKILR